MAELMKCKICGNEASWEKHYQNDPPEGKICDVCCRWICTDCIDWKCMHKTKTENTICKKCSKVFKNCL